MTHNPAPVAPSDFHASLTEAESACFRALAQILKLDEGSSALIGDRFGAVDCMAFAVGDMQNTDVLHSGKTEHFHFHAHAEFWFQDRAALQRILMLLVKHSPLAENHFTLTNVVTFRIAQDGIPAIERATINIGDPLQPDAEGIETAHCFTLKITFDLVFFTGPRK